MNKGFYWKMAFDGLKKNKRMFFPYFLTCIMTTAMFYIMNSLSHNMGFERIVGGETVQILMLLGRNIIGIFSIIFLMYTNSFLMKNRKKELGIYHILGMERKHIIRMISYEWIQTTIVTIGIGLLVGILLDKMMFLILLRLMQQKVVFGFYIGKQIIIETIIFFLVLHSILLMNTIWSILRSKTIELLYSSSYGEREPKNKWWITLIGLICIGSGYLFSIRTTDILKAFPIFFLAVLLVMIGTYCIFISGTITLLKILKSNSNYYYKPNHFISVSTMMYRMKKNGIGLANICILSTMVLIALSTTISLWSGIKNIIQFRYPKEMMIRFDVLKNGINKEEGFYKIEREIQNIVQKNNGKQIEKEVYLECNATVIKDNNHFIAITSKNKHSKEMYYLSVMTIDDYNRYKKTNFQLDENEILIYGKTGWMENEKMDIFGVPFSIKYDRSKEDQSKEILSIIPQYHIAVSSKEQIKLLQEAYNKRKNKNIAPFRLMGNIYFDMDGTEENILFITKRIEEYLKKENIDGYMESRTESKGSFYTLYSGFLFLGIFLSVLFLGAMILIMYYKQIAEGYEDQNSFQILQKVGMDREEIQKIISSQILMVFFLPLMIAGIHIIFAFPIVNRLLKMLYLDNTPLFIRCTFICFLVFAMLYFFVYKMTSKMYYKIVK